MPYISPSQFVYRTLITPDIWNQQVAGNIAYLHDKIETVWCPLTFGNPASVFTIANTTYPSALLDANGELVAFSFFIPPDFAGLTSLDILIIANATATLNYDIRSQYAAVGEPISTHTQSALGQTISLTNTLMYAIDLSSIVTSLAAGDYLGCSLENNGTTSISVLGARLRYIRT